MVFKTQSSRTSLLSFGKLDDMVTPSALEVDFDKQEIVVSKRNWHLIGVDRDVFFFRHIRRLTIDTHLIGADVTIRIVGSKCHIPSIPKADAKELMRLFREYNENNPKHAVIIG